MSQDKDQRTSSVAALTRVRALTHVKRPEDLPPRVARDIAEIVATHVPTWGGVLRRELPMLLAVFVGTGVALFAYSLVSGLPMSSLQPVLLGGFIGGAGATLQMKRMAPMRVASEHMKELGIPLRARMRIIRRIRDTAGMAIPLDPKDRLPVDSIVAALDPAPGDLIGDVAPPRILASRAEELDATVVRTFTEQWVDYRTRRLAVLPAFLFGILMLGLSLVGAFPSAKHMFFVLSFLGGPVGLIYWLRNLVEGPLRMAGLPPRERKRMWRAVSTARKRIKRALKAAPKSERIGLLADSVTEQLKSDVNGSEPPRRA